MPLQNRVSPFGELFADPAGGTFMGNRGGRIHRDDRTLSRRRFASRQWICCRARLQGAASRGLGRRLYRTLLSRRVNRARRRAPAVLRMPTRGRAGTSRRRSRGPCGCRPCRAPPRWIVSFTPSAWRAAASAAIPCRSTACRTASFYAALGAQGRLRGAGDCLLVWTLVRLLQEPRASGGHCGQCPDPAGHRCGTRGRLPAAMARQRRQVVQETEILRFSSISRPHFPTQRRARPRIGKRGARAAMPNGWNRGHGRASRRDRDAGGAKACPEEGVTA